MHAAFKDRLAALVKHYLQNGVTPRIHGNKGKQPSELWYLFTIMQKKMQFCFLAEFQVIKGMT